MLVSDTLFIENGIGREEVDGLFIEKELLSDQLLHSHNDLEKRHPFLRLSIFIEKGRELTQPGDKHP